MQSPGNASHASLLIWNPLLCFVQYMGSLLIHSFVSFFELCRTVADGLGGGRRRNRPYVRGKIALRYTSPLDVEIEGTQVDLAEIGVRVRALATRGAGKISFSGRSKGTPAPYNIWLESLVVCVGAGRLVASVDGNRELTITGGAKNVETLASYFAFPIGTPDGHHKHLEYHPGDKWIAEESVPIVVSVRVEPQTRVQPIGSPIESRFPASLSLGNSPMTLEKIHSLAKSGRVIEAIVAYRQMSGLGLKEAKDYIDRIEKE